MYIAPIAKGHLLFINHSGHVKLYFYSKRNPQ